MDAAKKTALEQRVVLGLVGLFAVTFFIGPLRGLGLFARRAPVSPAMEKVSVAEPLSVMMQPQWQQADRQAGAQDATRPASAPTDGPRYTAQHLRDPLKSLLPAEPSQQEPAAATTSAAGTPSAPPPSSPPPALEVQGMIWDAAEPQVIIDDRVYGIDDMVNGGRIQAIDRDGVTVDYQGQSVSYAPSR
ncbi:MAG: hypothetical protein HYZ96_02295 [Candidatus Omnitrophica bacterium]|nr:hypothetical protein [Candidatus Omnitrophota bacterium]